MEILTRDVVVIGCGAAGLRAALAARAAGARTLAVAKDAPGKGTCSFVSGGVMALAADDETPEDHARRTVMAGRGINVAELVAALSADASERVKELIGWGLKGTWRHEHFCSGDRAPNLGTDLIRCLLGQCEEAGVEFMGGARVTRLIPESGGVAVGVVSRRDGATAWIRAGAAVLATGGAAAVFRRHDNPRRMVGEGYRLALDAGVPLRDMEFTQFYPLGLAEPGVNALLIPPRLGNMGIMVNERGEDVLDKYGIVERPAAEKARDLLSRALFRETVLRGRKVFLDLRGVTEEQWTADPFAGSMRGLLVDRHGADKRPLGIAPMAHHVMGGVVADEWGATCVDGVYAAGEVTGGLHGANRMAGNALSETIVFGARAGRAAAEFALRGGAPKARPMPPEEALFAGAFAIDDQVYKDGMARLRDVMWRLGGPARSGASLREALDEVYAVREAATNGGKAAGAAEAAANGWELHCALTSARLMLEAALRREESRGAHFREDFPKPDDRKGLGHWTARPVSGGEWEWQFEKCQ